MTSGSRLSLHILKYWRSRSVVWVFTSYSLELPPVESLFMLAQCWRCFILYICINFDFSAKISCIITFNDVYLIQLPKVVRTIDKILYEPYKIWGLEPCQSCLAGWRASWKEIIAACGGKWINGMPHDRVRAWYRSFSQTMKGENTDNNSQESAKCLWQLYRGQNDSQRATYLGTTAQECWRKQVQRRTLRTESKIAKKAGQLLSEHSQPNSQVIVKDAMYVHAIHLQQPRVNLSGVGMCNSRGMWLSRGKLIL